VVAKFKKFDDYKRIDPAATFFCCSLAINVILQPEDTYLIYSLSCF